MRLPLILLLCFERTHSSREADPNRNCSHEDILIWKNKIEFSLFLNTIANKNLALPGPVRRDLKAQYPSLSQGCTECFIQNIACGAFRCLLQCIGKSLSPGCFDCCNLHCNPALRACLDVDELDMPVVPRESDSTPEPAKQNRPVRVRKPPSVVPSEFPNTGSK